MPLLDHFRPPVSDEIQWNTFHAVWAGTIADQLTQIVPDQYRVHEHLKLGGGLEIDVAAVRTPTGANGSADERRSQWQPSPPAASGPVVFPERFEVLVYRQSGGRQLVAAIELVSPGNKDSDETRDAFTAKVVSYLHEGVSVAVIDVVTERRANLHNQVARAMQMPSGSELPAGAGLYAASYRPVIREAKPEIEVWIATFAVGDPLPTMPLRLIADYFVPVDFEAAYTDARRRRKLI
jgi:hypothetical protein